MPKDNYCRSTYSGNRCEDADGHKGPHSYFIEGWGDLTWTDEQAEAEYQKAVDFWAERGVLYPPPSPDASESRPQHAWYTSGDGCDVASGDEYHHGYTVHCRASDRATAREIARAANIHRIVSFLPAATEEEVAKLATLVGFMAECGTDPAVFRIDESGVSCEARGKRGLLSGALVR